MIEYAIADTLYRHHLNTYQKAVVALGFLDFEKKDAKSRQGTRTDLMEPTSVNDFTQVAGRADEKAADMVHISHMTLSKVRYIEQKGTEELKLKCRKDEVSVSEAYSLLHKVTPKHPKLPIFKETKFLSPIKLREHEYAVWIRIPEDWQRGVRVIIKPLIDECQIAMCEHIKNESEIKKALEILMSAPTKEKRQFQNCLKMHQDKIEITFAEEGQAEKVQSRLEKEIDDNFDLENSESLLGSISTNDHSIFINYKTPNRLNRENFEEFVKEFLKANCTEFSKSLELTSSESSPLNPRTVHSNITQADREFVKRVQQRQEMKGITFYEALTEVGEEIRREDQAENEEYEQELKEMVLEEKAKSEEAERHLEEELIDAGNCKSRKRGMAIRALRKRYGEQIFTKGVET
jgi:hypothetical protein